MAGQDSVLTHDRHYIRSYTDGTQVKQGNELGKSNTVIQGKSLHELEAHATATQMLIRIGIILALGIQNRHCIGQHIIRHMMITDDKVYAALLGISYLLHGLDAAIKNNNQLYACLIRIIHTFTGYAIAFLVTVWYIIVNVGIILLQEPIHEGNSRTAIHIIVAIDQDTLLTSKGSIKTGHSLVHVLEQKRIEQS